MAIWEKIEDSNSVCSCGERGYVSHRPRNSLCPRNAKKGKEG